MTILTRSPFLLFWLALRTQDDLFDMRSSPLGTIAIAYGHSITSADASIPRIEMNTGCGQQQKYPQQLQQRAPPFLPCGLQHDRSASRNTRATVTEAAAAASHQHRTLPALLLVPELIRSIRGGATSPRKGGGGPQSRRGDAGREEGRLFGGLSGDDTEGGHISWDHR